MLKQGEIKKIVKKKFPEPLALIVSQGKNGKINLCPIGYFSLVSWDPKIWGIGLYKEHYSTKVISDTKEFVLCLPSFEQVNDVLYSGSVSGKDVNKAENVKLKFIKSKRVKPPLIDDSIACFECQVLKEIKIGDSILFLGKIVTAYESDKNWTEKIYNWDDKKLGTIKLGDNFQNINYSPEGE